MTGQVLAGQDPASAAKYQVTILYLIACGAAVATVVALALAGHTFLDGRGRLQGQLLGRHNDGPREPLLEVCSTFAAAAPTVDGPAPRVVLERAGSPCPPKAAAVLAAAGLAVRSPAGTLLATVPRLELYRGEIVALKGPSGCGKTTLFGALAGGIGANDDGGLALRGRQLRELAGAEWRAAVLLVPQHPPPLRFPAARVLAEAAGYAARQHDPGKLNAAGMAAAARLGLDPRAFDDTALAELSGGERQRAILAVAFALRPTVLLLDEPTSALDATVAAAVVRELVAAAAGGVAVAVITHDPTLVPASALLRWEALR